MDVETKHKFTVKSRIQSVCYALKGIAFTFKHERSIWLQALIAVAIVILGFLLKISSTEWIVIILCIGVVFAAEITNTAIEAIVDFISPEYHKQAGIIKDLAAGAVLTMAITTAIIVAIIFITKIIALL